MKEIDSINQIYLKYADQDWCLNYKKRV
jgi:hypothetical protein